MPEAAVGVLALAAGSLHDAVEADEVTEDYSHADMTPQPGRTHRQPRGPFGTGSREGRVK